MQKRHARGLGGIVFGGFFVFIATMMASDRIDEIRRGLNSSDWPTVEGQVTHSSIKRRGGSRRTGGRTRLAFSYSYVVGDVSFEGRRVAATAIDLGRIPGDYPSGRVVRVYVDPDEPGYSLLEPGVTVAAATLSLAPFIAVATLGLCLGVWGVRAGFRR